MVRRILNELLWFIKIFNKDINYTELHDIYIALEYKGRNLHNFSSLRAPCNEKEVNPLTLVEKFYKQNTRYEIMYSNIKQLLRLLVKYTDKTKFKDTDL